MIALRAQALNDVAKATRRRCWLTVAPRWVSRVPARSAWAMAASVMLAFTAGLVWFSMRPTAYATEIGERQLAALDAGSQVSLDAATTVTVRMQEEGRPVALLAARAKNDV